jgi:hypothetical protein
MEIDDSFASEKMEYTTSGHLFPIPSLPCLPEGAVLSTIDFIMGIFKYRTGSMNKGT